MTRKPAPKNLSCERQLDECPMNAPCHNGSARDSLNTEADPKSHLKSRRQSQTLAKHRLCHRPTCRSFDQVTNIDRNVKQNKIIKGIKASGENAIDSHSLFFIQQIPKIPKVVIIFNKDIDYIYY